ncbi:hypothetical protein B0H13DRAFT_2228071 [Mycena leptocephala]|nr:hypothetical protein B0H13DRAFT_2228071 [Mycena leptocephala]
MARQVVRYCSDVGAVISGSFWSEITLIIPFYVGTASIVTLLLHLFWVSRPGLKLRTQYFKTVTTEPEYAPEAHSIAEHVESHGGITIFSFKAARLVGCLVLLSLSIVSLASDSEDDEQETSTFAFWEAKTHKSLRAMVITYFYASVLAIISVAGSAKWGTVAVKHLNTLLLSTSAVYFYRDVFPLATNELVPLDLAEGRVLWVKIMTLFTVSGIIPLLIPRQYIPVDPKSPHLKFDQLPPLCDYDYAENLRARAWPHMDVFSGKKRHIFFGIIWIYRWTFWGMAVMLTIMALAAFISPIGINRLLAHLEDPNQASSMKPWFWILLLFLGPTINSLAFQWYIFISTHIMTQTTAIITQLVFEHALRIRVKSETGGKGQANAVASGRNNGRSKKASANLHGKMTNLVTTDLTHINEARNLLFLVILVPIQIIGAIVFLYRVLGWRVMVALFPLPGYVSKLQQEGGTQNTDARVQTVSETMNVLRMIKMFGWEKQMDVRIADKREEELKKLWRRRLLDMASVLLNYLIPLLTMLATYGLFPSTVIAHQELSAAKVFSSMTVFDLLRGQMWFTFHNISTAVNGKVSLDRLNDFLHNTELLDSFTSEDTPEIIAPDERPSNVIALFKPGCVNLVLGPTGSGKTSLLMALLGEMHLVPSPLPAWYNLPRGHGVSYAAQESWVMNDTIRNNILFNSPMNQERYNKVLYQCCLERDLELWDAGDATEVGEKGLTLSGGQKARVTLARAIYADAEIILLDDVLAALDVHTAKWIVEKCLSGDLIKNRTVILVTHNVVLTSKIAGFVVSLGLDGRVRSQGSISDALEKDEHLAKEVIKEQEIVEATERELDASSAAEAPKKKDGKLVVPEEIALGHVSRKALNLYFHGMGGGATVPFFFILVLAIVATEVLNAMQTWFLGYWASLVLFALTYIYYTIGSFRASRIIHRQLVESVLGTTFRWLDFTPTSRIIARCTVDISAVDTMFPQGLQKTISMLTKFGAVVIFTPVFFLAGALVGIIGAACGRIYIASRLSVKREQSNAKAPVLALYELFIISSSLASVRAYGAQETFIRLSMERINRSTRASRTFASLNRWVTVRIGQHASSLAYYLVYFQSERPSNIGFSLNMALAFANSILAWVHVVNQFEVQGNSLERIQSYLTIEQEPKPTASGIPPAYWPASGNLSVDNLSAKYSPDGPTVLHNISFNINSGERVGVVGRTGSGKSSLTLSLLRCIFTEGTVSYDGLSTSSINLEALRSNITIIPQVPELLVGSLRSNLDMLGQFDDANLNAALRSAGLSSLQEDMNEGKLTLDSEISAARAIVRGSKLMILDEDYKTDEVIQSSLRTELPRDTTLLIVAHRLQTIMDADKIMVLDAGRIALLQKKHGLLRSLVDESGDKEALHRMAQA